MSQHVARLSEEQKRREQRLKEKRAHLAELLVYIVSLQHLRERNARLLRASPPAASPAADQIPLRFVLIKTAASNIVHLSVSPDQTELQCDVSGTFVLHDEGEVLREMGLASIDSFDLPNFIPRELSTFYPSKYIKRSQPAHPQHAVVDETVGGRIGAGTTISLGGNRKR